MVEDNESVSREIMEEWGRECFKKGKAQALEDVERIVKNEKNKSIDKGYGYQVLHDLEKGIRSLNGD